MDLWKIWEEHPFAVLGATPRDTRVRLLELEAEKKLFGEEDQIQNAVSALLYPESRLAAELTWFPQTNTAEIQKLSAYMKKCLKVREEGSVRIIGVGRPPEFHTRSAVARFNSVRLFVALLCPETESAYLAVVHSLVTVADTLLPKQVMDELNADRLISRFPALQKQSEIRQQTTILLEQTAGWLAQMLPESLNHPAGISSILTTLKKELKDHNSLSHGSFFQELLRDALEIRKLEEGNS